MVGETVGNKGPHGPPNLHAEIDGLDEKLPRGTYGHTTTAEASKTRERASSSLSLAICRPLVVRRWSRRRQEKETNKQNEHPTPSTKVVYTNAYMVLH